MHSSLAVLPTEALTLGDADVTMRGFSDPNEFDGNNMPSSSVAPAEFCLEKADGAFRSET